MAKFGNRRFKKTRTRNFVEVREGKLVRVTIEQIRGQKLRDRVEHVEVLPTLRGVPGVWPA